MSRLATVIAHFCFVPKFIEQKEKVLGKTFVLCVATHKLNSTLSCAVSQQLENSKATRKRNAKRKKDQLAKGPSCNFVKFGANRMTC